MRRDDTSPEALVRDWLDHVAGRMGLGIAWNVRGRPADPRAPVRVALVPPKGSDLAHRRWMQVAASLQTLLEATLATRGLGDVTVEVTLSEAPAAGRAAPEPVQDEGLVQAARTAAQVAVRTGRAFALGPMTVGDRRQVHQALGELPDVWTQSEGEGIFRRLWIVPRALLRPDTDVQPDEDAASAAAPGDARD